MKIGVPKEIKTEEHRVGLTPEGVAELHRSGHEVVVEAGAGAGIRAGDDDYSAAGATIAATAAAVFDSAELVVKVKEPQPVEVASLKPGQVLFTYLHLAADRELTTTLAKSQAVGIAYETVTAADGSLPLLAPMSEVAGRLSVQAGARALERAQGGAGLLLGGVAGVPGARVVVIGGGVVGTNAIEMALGLQADVTVLDTSLPRLRQLAARFEGRLRTVFATETALRDLLPTTDLLIAAVLVPGAAAPKIVKRDMLASMRTGSVIVDVAVDQGGCCETTRPTTHSDPVYVVDGVVHYCVANMPGAVPLTSTRALTAATLPYVLRLAELGWRRALLEDRHLRNGLNVSEGKVRRQEIADATGTPFAAAEFETSAA